MTTATQQPARRRIGGGTNGAPTTTLPAKEAEAAQPVEAAQDDAEALLSGTEAAHEAAPEADGEPETPTPVRRGRPRGSKNKTPRAGAQASGEEGAKPKTRRGGRKPKAPVMDPIYARGLMATAAERLGVSYETLLAAAVLLR